MRAERSAMAVAMAAMLALVACTDKTPTLMHLRSSTQGPDEFGILPPKGLELPEDLVTLPEPTLGGANRTDPTPIDDAIVAMGGTPRKAGGVPAADSALVNQAARKGIASGIRETLAAEDLKYRQRNNGRLLERLFNINSYFRAYKPLSLDQQADLARWRKLGVRTPSAPPRKPGE